MSETFELSGKRIWVAGHRGMVGSAIARALRARGDCEVITVSRSEIDLLRQAEVETWMEKVRPEAVFLAAARVGGIMANSTRPAEFLYQNLMIEANIIHAAHSTDVEKLLFLGSSCIYPKLAAQPMREDALLTGPLEPTNEWYAIAKIAGIKMCDAYRKQYGRHFISAMPTNLYGPNDNFDPVASHVLAALMRKIHDAKKAGAATVEIWGTGSPLREFMHVDDLASACIFLMERYDQAGHINVGHGEEVTIRALAEQIANVAGYQGAFHFDTTKPDGTPRKLMDSTALRSLGWTARIGLEDGIRNAYGWFEANQAALRAA
ncbi:MAG: GDP-L-fucose synthase [Terricaulis sp.]